MLSIKNIEVYYGNSIALKGISLEVGKGTIVTILGANGAGKTTILRTISGFLSPEKGVIEFLGQRIFGMEPFKIVRLGIGHVPQGREIFLDLTVQENLVMGSLGRRSRQGVARALVENLFPVLKERQKQTAGTLSGGEQQMLAIGRALMGNPRLLLLDEPSLGLAPLVSNHIFQTIRMINREGTTILLVEQDAHQALSVAHFGYVLEVGRIVLADFTEKLLSNEDIKEFYLGMEEESIKGYKRYKRRKRWS